MTLLRLARQLGIETCLEFEPAILVPEQRVREFCFENKCGNYGNNYMCPPHIGSLFEIKNRLKKFRRGALLQHSSPLDVANDITGLRETKLDFHNRILQLESSLMKKGVNDVWGMIGGNCALCQFCKARTAEPCPYPEKARTSLESIGIDVMRLLNRLGLDNRFRPDRITWTGCVLF